MSKIKKKIAIYTICKNEETNSSGWITNVKNADYVLVGDTGSKDQTISILEKHGIEVVPIEIYPWRFDSARNKLLSHIPANIDICISLDFDERLNDGWREAVESVWSDKTSKLTYNYLEQLQGNYNLTNTIITSRVHSRKGYKWVYPIHETLRYILPSKEQVAFCPRLTIIHTPDRSKNRAGYLKLMELSVEENPENLIFLHNLGRLYFQHHRYDECIHSMERILKHLDSPTDLCVASKRYVYRAWAEKDQYDFSQKKLLELIEEYPHCSSAYAELCTLAYRKQDFETILHIANNINKIDFHYKSNYNEFANVPSLLYDIISFAYFQQKQYPQAMKFAHKALDLDPLNIRLKKNIEKIKKYN